MIEKCDAPTESSLLELFASVERISKFKESTIILSDGDDEMSTGVELTEG